MLLFASEELSSFTRQVQFVVHGDLAHLGFQSGDFILAIVALAFLQRGRRAGERSVPPFGQLSHRDIGFPGDDIQRFAPQQDPMGRG